MDDLANEDLTMMKGSSAKKVQSLDDRANEDL